MVPTFCLRLAWGLIASMLILPREQTPPRFFRVHFLIALGLLTAAGFFLFTNGGHGPQSKLPALTAEPSKLAALTTALGISLVACCAGSIVWHVEGAPLARSIMILAIGGLFSAMFVVKAASFVGAVVKAGSFDNEAWSVADDVTSAALLGSCTSAMLMGHSYLIAPAMSLAPLLRLLGAMGITLVLRVILAGIGLFEMERTTAGLDNETMLLLSLRWGFGFVGVLVLGWMAWESARIRSTQSATGILYVVVVFCFLGELCGQLLEMKTGFVL